MRDTWAPIKKTAWISLIFSCGISIYLELGMVYWFVPHAGKSTLDFFHLVHTAITGTILLFLLFANVRKHKYWTRTLATIAFLFVVLPTFPFTIYRTLWGLENNDPFIPFGGASLVLILFGVLVPGPVWINAILIAAMVTEVMVLWYGYHVGEISKFVDPNQPVTTLLHASVAYVLLVFRWRYEQALQNEADAKARARALEENAEVFLALKDRANTPLQTLEFSVALLERENPETRHLNEIRNSVRRLGEINIILSRYELNPFHEDVPDRKPGLETR